MHHSLMNIKEIKRITQMTKGVILDKLPFENVTIPESSAVYIVTKNIWNDEPSISSEP